MTPVGAETRLATVGPGSFWGVEQILSRRPGVVESAVGYVRRHLDIVERHLAVDRDYLMEQGFGLADLLLTAQPRQVVRSRSASPNPCSIR